MAYHKIIVDIVGRTRMVENVVNNVGVIIFLHFSFFCIIVFVTGLLRFARMAHAHTCAVVISDRWSDDGRRIVINLFAHPTARTLSATAAHLRRGGARTRCLAKLLPQLLLRAHHQSGSFCMRSGTCLRIFFRQTRRRRHYRHFTPARFCALFAVSRYCAAATAFPRRRPRTV